MSDFSRNLQRLRKRAGLSQEGLAETLSVTRQTVSSWERGKSYPDLDTLLQLAEALSASPNDLLYPPERKPRLADAGKRVPEDVSVIGLDGLPIGAYLIPQLTTVSQSVGHMAQRSVDILLKCIEEDGKAQHETVPFRIDRRESVRKLEQSH